MLRDVPDARLIGSARLTGWRRDISALLAGPAERASIHRTDDPADHCDGVAYELSWWGKVRLDRLERRAYQPVEVSGEINGQPRPAFTYELLPTAVADRPLSPGSWLDSSDRGCRRERHGRPARRAAPRRRTGRLGDPPDPLIPGRLNHPDGSRTPPLSRRPPVR
jgi:hypothetical protein